MRILLIEDDEILVGILSQSLSKQHYVVDIAKDGQTGWEYADGTSYDLIVMDVGLPKVDGISLCQRLRSQACSTPILLMTAKDANSDRIRGLDAGADDYLIKPFDLGEFQARVRALLRRSEIPRSPVLQVGALRLDPSSCEVNFAEQPLSLTPKEYNLLELFLRNPTRVFSRSEIIEHLWTFDDPPQEESVKSHIKSLRQKLKNAGAGDWVENVYGVGYRLNPQAEGKSTKSKTRKTSISQPKSATVNSDVEQQFNEAMGGLWQQYQGLMVERMAVLQQTAIALSANKLDLDLRQSAERAAHKLAGVLGMFGQETGTQIARDIEQVLATEQNLLPTQQRQLLLHIQELSNLLQLTQLNQTESSVELPSPVCLASNPQILLIDPDPQFGLQLQQLVQSTNMRWEQITNLETVNSYLQTTSPDLVILSIDEAGWREASLTLLLELTQRTPAIPVLVLANIDGLVDRVTVARAGARGFLAKPVTATQVWDVASQILEQTHSQVVNVLVVDDDPLILATLSSLLESWGMRMTALENPLRFWEVLQTVKPELLILDVTMPQLSGIELCQAVRTDPKWQRLPILFLTAHQDMKTVQQVFAAGADDYVVKPIVGSELLTRITQRLERVRLLKA